MVVQQIFSTDTNTMLTLQQFALSFASLGVAVAQLSLGPSTFTAPGAFPTPAYSHYFNSPTATSAQVQPVISDPVLVCCSYSSRQEYRIFELTIKCHSTKSILHP
jgi:hypothetical protein